MEPARRWYQLDPVEVTICLVLFLPFLLVLAADAPGGLVSLVGLVYLLVALPTLRRAAARASRSEPLEDPNDAARRAGSWG